jgi:hypothetical protein
VYSHLSLKTGTPSEFLNGPGHERAEGDLSILPTIQRRRNPKELCYE